MAKVIFTYILGYKVDIGHMEAVNLISSPKYSEKQIVSLSLELSQRNDLIAYRAILQLPSLCMRTPTSCVSS